MSGWCWAWKPRLRRSQLDVNQEERHQGKSTSDLRHHHKGGTRLLWMFWGWGCARIAGGKQIRVRGKEEFSNNDLCLAVEWTAGWGGEYVWGPPAHVVGTPEERSLHWAGARTRPAVGCLPNFRCCVFPLSHFLGLVTTSVFVFGLARSSLSSVAPSRTPSPLPFCLAIMTVNSTVHTHSCAKHSFF